MGAWRKASFGMAWTTFADCCSCGRHGGSLRVLSQAPTRASASFVGYIGVPVVSIPVRIRCLCQFYHVDRMVYLSLLMWSRLFSSFLSGLVRRYDVPRFGSTICAFDICPRFAIRFAVAIRVNVLFPSRRTAVVRPFESDLASTIRFGIVALYLFESMQLNIQRGSDSPVSYSSN